MNEIMRAGLFNLLQVVQQKLELDDEDFLLHLLEHCSSVGRRLKIQKVLGQEMTDNPNGRTG